MARITIDPAFDFELPDGWTADPDEEGGVNAGRPDGPGLLHLIAFEQPGDQDLDPAEELYIFLEDQGIELEEDEIDDFELADGSELSVCEYVAEDDESDPPEAIFCIVGVATTRGSLVFSNYTCPADQIESERDAVRTLLMTLRLHPPADLT